MLLPWRSFNSNRTAKFQSHWDARLEALAKEVDKIFRKLKKSRQDCTELWSTFHTLEKQIKRSVRNKKKGIRTQELNAMAQKSVPETQKWVKKYLRRSNTAAMQSLQRGSPLDLASFTRHMETKRDNITRIPTRNFIVPRDFCSHIQRSISNLPNGSAAGQDMIYYEMFKIGADTLAQFLMALWTTCCRLNHRPLEWNKGRLVPLYKKGDPAIPSNHRPICLLSATREIIERAIASAMNKSFTPHRAQMGFQKHMGTEMALAQMHRASNQRQNWIAILDLKSAYVRVCRATLMKRCDETLTEMLANMVSHIIQELEVHTVGDETGTTAKINSGMTQ